MKYGVRFDGENSAGVRTYDAVGKTWTRSSNATSGQDDFLNFGIKECITTYNAETGKREVLAYEGDSDWATLVVNKTGDRMIEIPLFYYSRPSKYEFIISDTQESGFKPSPMHYHKGVLYQTMRISKYALNSAYVSQTGETPRISTNLNTFRTNVRAKGQYIMDYPTWCSLVMLMLVKYANMDVQSVVGAGRNSGRAVIISGGTDSVLGVDGSATDLATNESVLTLGIENFYSNVFKFIDGLYSYNANIYIKDIEEIESDPTSAEELQSTYSVVTERIPESGVNANIKNIAYDEEYDWMLFPTENGTPNPFGDRYITNKNFNSVVVGGSAWLSAADGLFFFMVLAVGSTGTGGGAMAIEFGELAGGDIVKETDISFSNLSEYDGLLRNDTNILRRNVAYTQNQIVNKGKVFLKCTVAGTTDTNTLNLTNISVDDILTDGTVTWKVLSVNGIPENSGGGSSQGISIWQANTDYEVNDIVVKGKQLYECITAHTSATWSSDISNWELLSGTETWAENTTYKAKQIIYYDGKLYYVNTTFTSGAVFDETNLTEISGSGGSGQSEFRQRTFENVTTSQTVNIKVNKSLTQPPIEVLKEGTAQTNVQRDIETFDDGEDFNYDSDYVVFDGNAYLKTEYEINMTTPTVLGDGYTSMSNQIDLSQYDTVEEVDVE